jgi:hypothetical protein
MRILGLIVKKSEKRGKKTCPRRESLVIPWETI